MKKVELLFYIIIATLFFGNIAKAEKIRVLEGHANEIQSLAVSLDGRYLISGGEDSEDTAGNIKIWDLSTGEIIQHLNAQEGRIFALDVSPDGQYFISGTWGSFNEKIANQNKIKIWEFETGHLINTIGVSDRIEALKFTPNGKYFVSSSYREFKIWEFYTSKLIGTIRGHSNWIASIRITPDSEKIITRSDNANDSDIRVWKLDTGKLIFKIDYPSYNNGALEITPDGKYIIAGGDRQELKMWDISNGKLIKSFNKLKGVSSLSVSPNGKYIVTTHGKNKIIVSDIRNKRIVNTFFTSKIRDPDIMLMSPNGDYVAIAAGCCDSVFGAWNRAIEVWDSSEFDFGRKKIIDRKFGTAPKR